MNDKVLSYDDLLIILYRMLMTLCRSAVSTGQGYNAQLHEYLYKPKPLDWIALTAHDELPAALKIGRLIQYTAATDESPCTYTVNLLDGTITTWKNANVVKIPTKIFSMAIQF